MRQKVAAGKDSLIKKAVPVEKKHRRGKKTLRYLGNPQVLPLKAQTVLKMPLKANQAVKVLRTGRCRMAEKDKYIRAYFLRVSEEIGIPYQGYAGSIANTLEAKQKYVNFGKDGGLIQAVHLNGELDVICHDEGKLLGFPLNRAWVDESGRILDVFAGNIMVVRHKGDEFASVFDGDIPCIEKYLVPVCPMDGNQFVRMPSGVLPEWEGGADGNPD